MLQRGRDGLSSPVYLKATFLWNALVIHQKVPGM
jgi:hypothetical protein